MSTSTRVENVHTKMAYQPILNIGCLGSVSDGKSTTVFQLTGTKTQRHSNEKTRNITIKPGYANMKVWLKSDGEYETTNSEGSIADATLVHHLSFVDCPGHQELILAMMGSVSLMRGAIVVVSAAEPISKKPQLIQHLAAAKMGGLERLIVIFNKLDLITQEKAIERKEELDELLAKLEIKPRYIIPTALNKKIGLQNVIKAIMEVFPPELSESSATETAEFRITRSFDVNKPGTNWDKMVGGVFGGSLLSGTIKVGDEIEIRPGQYAKKKDGSFTVMPIVTTVNSIQTDKISLETLHPGGLTAIGTDVDPFYCKDDKLSGAVVGLKGTLPPVYQEITMNVTLTSDFDGNWSPKRDDNVYLQIGNVNTEAQLVELKGDDFKFKLSKPSCISADSLILVCCNVGDILKIVGFGYIRASANKPLI
jgi:translation initiation factor 2 subunit 3